MTLDELYLNIYDLVSLIFLNQGIIAEIYQSDTDIALPVTEDPYIVLGYAPSSFKKIGSPIYGEVTVPGGEEANYLVRFVLYSGEVEIRQVNGNGEFLKKIVSALDAQYCMDFYYERGFSVSEFSTGIITIPFAIDSKTHKESIVSPVFLFYDMIKENMEFIEDVQIGGSLSDPVGEIRNVEISKGVISP